MYYDDYEEYQSFSDIEALNEAVYLQLYYNADQLNKTDKTVYKLLSRFSCVIPGVSWMKVATIAKHVEKSEKTVRRVLKRLEGLRMIKRIPTIRKQGGRGYDICVIEEVGKRGTYLYKSSTSSNNEPDQAECPGEQSESSPRESKRQKESDHKETSTIIKPNNTYYSRPYARFRKLIAQYVDAPQRTISRLYGVYLGVTKYLRLGGYTGDELMDFASRALSATFHAQKRGRLRTLTGYFSGVLNRMLDQLYAQEVAGLTDTTADSSGQALSGAGV